MTLAFHVRPETSGPGLYDIDSIIQSHSITCQKIGKSLLVEIGQIASQMKKKQIISIFSSCLDFPIF